MTLTSIPGSIQQILTEDFVVYTQDDTLTENSNSFIEFKLVINKSTKLFRRAKFIEINFIDTNQLIFKNQFKKNTPTNNFSKLNENKTSYSTIQNEEDFILKDISSNKDAYVSYQSTFDFNSDFNFTVDFNTNNYNQESKIYEILLDLEKTRSIINKSIPRGGFPNPLTKINISILDKDKNIIDQTGFKNINFSLGNLIRKINTSDRLKFSKYYLDYFERSIRLNHFEDAIQISYDGNSLEKLNIDALEFNLTYFLNNGSRVTLSKNKTRNSISAIFNQNTAGFTNFINKIMLDFLNNNETFKFLISVKLLKADRSLEGSYMSSINENLSLNTSITQNSSRFSNTVNLNNLESINAERQRQRQRTLDKNQASLFNKSRQSIQSPEAVSFSNSNYEIDLQNFSLQRGSNFINAIKNISGNSIINRCFGSPSNPKVTNLYEKEENKIKLIYNFNQILPEFYDKIKIKSFFIDQVDLEYYYNDKSFSVENKVFYKGQTIKDLIDFDNQIIVYKNLTSNPINASIIFEIVDFDNDRRIDFNEIREVIEEVNYNNIINQTNSIFKNNITFSNIILNTTIKSEAGSKNLFNYARIALTNIEYFQDFAYNYGYIKEDEKPDVVDFLNNCVLQIENNNTIDHNENNSSNLHSKFIFLRNIFNFENVTGDTVYSNVVSQNQFLNGDDINFVREITDSNLKDFLTSENSLSNASKNLTKFNVLNIRNFLSLKILPIPKIIFENLRSGIEIDNNYRNTALVDYSRLESTDYAERLDKEIVKYFFNNNSSLNYNKFNRFINVLYSDDVENNITADSFVEMFQELSNANIEPRNFFTKETIYNKSEIIRSLSLGNDNFSFLQENILETINNNKPKSDHFNLQINDNVISLLENQMPFEFEVSE